MADSPGIDAVFEFIATAMEPLVDWIDDDQITAYVEGLGWELPLVPSGLTAIHASVDQLMQGLADLRAARLQEQSETTALAEIGAGLGLVIAAIEATPDSLAAELPPDFIASTDIVNQFTKRLLDALVIDAISATSQTVRALLLAVGVIQEDQNDTFVLRQLVLDRVSLLVSDPKTLLSQVYGWGTTALDQDRLFSVLREIASVALVGVDVRFPSPQFISAMFPGATAPSGDRPAILAVPLIGLGFPPLAIGILPAFTSTPTELQGLALRLLGTPSLSISESIGANTTLSLQSDFAIDAGVGVLLRPNQAPTIVQNVESGALPAVNGKVVIDLRRTDPDGPLTIFDFGGGSLLTAQTVFAQLSLQIPPPELVVQAGLVGGLLHVSLDDADGFIGSVLSSTPLDVKFDVSIGWSSSRGLFFSGSAGLKTSIDLNLSIGPVSIDAIALDAEADQTGVHLNTGADVTVSLGPVDASIEGIGVSTELQFTSGNLGPMDLSADFLAPTGLGISVDAGPVSGGGFISFDSANSRYFGALELSIYSVSVKAFGIIETKFPDGHKGFSFLIIISAEFTPIQLGLGFTLTGVGGLAGINRSVDSAGLLAAVKKGDLDNVLFPTDVVDNAPAILHDLETIFPPTDGHYLFGPMAKIGWGTPTLVEAELGIIIEYPGPVLTVLGTVDSSLPKASDAVVVLHLDVAGVLDFPKKMFSLDASLHDSRVGDFPVSGDMSMRLTWGNDPNFALAIGGFNPHFNPPPGFPTLKPVSVDLGAHGNPSINLTGYLALTSNTAQVGAKLEASISKSGAQLYGFISFDALFVFSPFSFTADIEGGVKVTFHGHGFSLHFHGTISGPSPWHLDGQVCVSILFWDACVGFSVNLGGTSKPTLPGLDPWVGSQPLNADGTQEVPGLMPALQNVANWGGGPPPGSFAVVTLVAQPPGTPAPIDPLGTATVRQKAAPIKTPITKFAGTKPLQSRNFDIQTVTIGQNLSSNMLLPAGASNPAVVSISEPPLVPDLFAPAQFQDMKDADKLSSPSYVSLPAGFTVSSNALTFGSAASIGLTYDTIMVSAPPAPDAVYTQQYNPSQASVTMATARSATALGGIRGAAQARFVDPKAAPLVTLANDAFVLTAIATLQVTTGFSLSTPVSRPVAADALLTLAVTSATAFQTLQITPVFAAAH